MNSERNIIMKLHESSFQYKGSTYVCGFGHYSQDGEPIDREDYMKARDAYNKTKGSSERLVKTHDKVVNKIKSIASEDKPNEYSQKYSIGDKVRFIHAGGQLSSEVATIVGYDEDGYYKYQWDDGEISSGSSDDNFVGEDEDYDEEDYGTSEYYDGDIDTRTGRRIGVPDDFDGEDDEWDAENGRPYDSYYDED